MLTEMVKDCSQSQLNEKRTRFGRLCSIVLAIEISRIGSISLRAQTLDLDLRQTDSMKIMERLYYDDG
jgi:hypothetical protein